MALYPEVGDETEALIRSLDPGDQSRAPKLPHQVARPVTRPSGGLPRDLRRPGFVPPAAHSTPDKRANLDGVTVPGPSKRPQGTAKRPGTTALGVEVAKMGPSVTENRRWTADPKDTASSGWVPSTRNTPLRRVPDRSEISSLSLLPRRMAPSPVSNPRDELNPGRYSEPHKRRIPSPERADSLKKSKHELKTPPKRLVNDSSAREDLISSVLRARDTLVLDGDLSSETRMPSTFAPISSSSSIQAMPLSTSSASSSSTQAVHALSHESSSSSIELLQNPVLPHPLSGGAVDNNVTVPVGLFAGLSGPRVPADTDTLVIEVEAKLVAAHAEIDALKLALAEEKERHTAELAKYVAQHNQFVADAEQRVEELMNEERRGRPSLVGSETNQMLLQRIEDLEALVQREREEKNDLVRACDAFFAAEARGRASGDR